MTRPVEISVAIAILVGIAAASLLLDSGKVSKSLILGALFGTVLQRSRFCFLCHMRDYFSNRDPRGVTALIFALAVGTLGFPYIGTLQADKQIKAVEASPAAKEVPGLVENGKLTAVSEKSIYEIIKYQSIDEAKLSSLVGQLPEAEAAKVNGELKQARDQSNQKALRDMAVFPSFMLVCYLILIAYFATKGGYKPVHLVTDELHPATEG